MADVMQLHRDLAMLWLQNQDLSGVTPEELLQKYKEAYDAISDADAKSKGAQRISY